jgi:hypothetical protein
MILHLRLSAYRSLQSQGAHSADLCYICLHMKGYAVSCVLCSQQHHSAQYRLQYRLKCTENMRVWKP